MGNEISIVPFKFKYLELLLDMLRDQRYADIDHISMKTLPKVGYIALMNKQPIAAGFLRRVEGGYGQIDTLASNPYFGSQIRHEGINKVVEALINDAKDMKLQGLIAFTEDETVIRRSEASGFSKLRHSIISRRL